MQRLDELLNRYNIVVVDEPEEPQAPTCETCGGVGFVVTRGYLNESGEWQSGRTLTCPNPDCPTVARQRIERFHRLTLRAKLPREYATLTFTAWEYLIDKYRKVMTGKWDAYGAAKAFVKAKDNHFMFTLTEAATEAALSFDPRQEVGEKNSIVFAGTNGIGKTSLASAIVLHLLDQNYPAMYARTADILSAIRERFDKKQTANYEFDWGDSEMAIIANFQQAPVLVLDEFGVEMFSDWRRDTIEQIVRYRYANQMPTIYTTNLGYDELADDHMWGRKVGHAVHGMAHWFTMSGDELRRRTGAIQSR